jgi:alpha-L-fucosidase
MYETPTSPALPDGPFIPDWDSLDRFVVPRWYQDAKFGIFIHWGIYSVPAYGDEWYPNKAYTRGSPFYDHHVKTYGPHKTFGYKDFIPMFRAEHYDPAGWVDLFVRAGAKYVMPVAEHHDGFAMYDSSLTRWCAAKMGPKRDVVGELAAAARGRGLRFGVSNHRAEHWWFLSGGRDFESDVTDPSLEDFYGPAQPQSITPSRAFKQDWLERCCELVDRYEPELFYFDTWAERPPLKPYLKHFAAYYYNRMQGRGRQAAINYKNDCFSPSSAVVDFERGQAGDIRERFWQTDTAVGLKSWCHIADEEYRTAESIICDLADIVSKNGTLLLNIGPRADGTIPESDTRILEKIGAWLAVNGEAIYGTRPWRVFGEGPTTVPSGHFTDRNRRPFTSADFRFTSRAPSTLYAICLEKPSTRVLLIRSLGTTMRLMSRRIVRVEVLGSTAMIAWRQADDGLHVSLPDALPETMGLSLRITTEE